MNSVLLYDRLIRSCARTEPFDQSGSSRSRRTGFSQLLLRKMTTSGAILLTSDRRLMERGVIASSAMAALLVPISLKKRDQFAFLRAELGLPLKPTRCMACGGRLLAVNKESVRERIPPRTYPWLDDYYLCERCHRLFWEGTHWQRIKETLEPA
jgi:uncharacterized protein with PIN domain